MTDLQSAVVEIAKRVKEQENLVNTNFYSDKPNDDELTNWEFVSNCDWESADFNIGFEQGILRGREEAIQILNELTNK